ncbi:hypothetical protein SK128_023243, partial [Halocaridina rubra]
MAKKVLTKYCRSPYPWDERTNDVGTRLYFFLRVRCNIDIDALPTTESRGKDIWTEEL